MHMIEDFKEFADVKPSSLFQKNPEFTRSRIDVTGAGQDAYVELNVNLTEEKIVKIKRDVF